MNKVNMKYNFIEAAIDRGTDSASRLEEIQFHSKYSEPGYTTPESGIICTGNWNTAEVRNPVTGRYEKSQCNLVKRVKKILEKRYKAELEWSDEWTTCSECSGLIRTSPDCAFWTRSYVTIGGDELCRECCKDHVEEIIEQYEGTVKSLPTEIGIKPADHGFKLFAGELESGLHENMAAEPKTIAKSLKALGVSRYLFTLDEASQFYVTFSCWVHEDEIELTKDKEVVMDVSPSPAEAAKAMLAGVSQAPQVDPIGAYILESESVRKRMEDAGWYKDGDLWVSPVDGVCLSFDQARAEFQKGGK